MVDMNAGPWCSWPIPDGIVLGLETFGVLGTAGILAPHPVAYVISIFLFSRVLCDVLRFYI